MFAKILKFLWVISIFLNSIVIVDLCLFMMTGYYIFVYQPHNEFFMNFISLTISCTLLVIFIFMCRMISSIRRARKTKKIIYTSIIFIAFLLYGYCGLWFWASSQLNFSAVVDTTSYNSPSHTKKIVFKKACYFTNCINEAYENRGFFQRKVYIKAISDTSKILHNNELRNQYIDTFHDPSNIVIMWNEDEKIINWTVKVELKTIKGFINL